MHLLCFTFLAASFHLSFTCRSTFSLFPIFLPFLHVSFTSVSLFVFPTFFSSCFSLLVFRVGSETLSTKVLRSALCPFNPPFFPSKPPLRNPSLRSPPSKPYHSPPAPPWTALLLPSRRRAHGKSISNPVFLGSGSPGDPRVSGVHVVAEPVVKKREAEGRETTRERLHAWVQQVFADASEKKHSSCWELMTGMAGSKWKRPTASCWFAPDGRR